jgi:TRAP-type C4-dicarboxylate transport system substrate-binding protein
MKTSMRRTAALLASAAAFALVLTSCSGGAASSGGSGEGRSSGDGREYDNAGGTSVPFDATDEEWQTAFEDVDPIKIVWELSGAATTPTGIAFQKLADRAAELSDGKVDIELAFSLSVSGALTSVDQALQDGRIDIGMVTPYLESQEYPIAGTIANDINIDFPTAQIGGPLVGLAAASETLWNTPEFIQENADADLTVLSPYSSGPRSFLACREPVDSLEDLHGRQVRVAPITNRRQVEALDATPVSIQFTELFESVQRGLVDCIIAGLSTIGGLPGLAELVPNVYAPEGTNWSGTVGYYVAGINWTSYPLPVQQFLYDLNAQADVESAREQTQIAPPLILEDIEKAGGSWGNLPADASEELAAFNESLIEADWVDSSLFDGAAYIERWDEAKENWTGTVEELGVDFSEASETEEWSTAEVDWDAFAKAYYDAVVIPNRPI